MLAVGLCISEIVCLWGWTCILSAYRIQGCVRYGYSRREYEGNLVWSFGGRLANQCVGFYYSKPSVCKLPAIARSGGHPWLGILWIRELTSGELAPYREQTGQLVNLCIEFCRYPHSRELQHHNFGWYGNTSIVAKLLRSCRDTEFIRSVFDTSHLPIMRLPVIWPLRKLPLVAHAHPNRGRLMMPVCQCSCRPSA